MVSLSAVQASNGRIASALPSGLVAVFVGATNGIGEASLKQFAKDTRKPRVYFIGRSQEAGTRIAAECKALNAEGEYTFIKGDTSLIRNVDEICADLKRKEKSINLLFLTIGTLIAGVETAEKLHYAASLVLYSRTRFVVNLLPELQAATSLRRVVSVLAATKEGPINTADLQGWKLPILKQQGQGASLVTLSLEALAQKAPDVSFIHNFPGAVKSGIARGTTGPLMAVVKTMFTLLGPFFYIPLKEVGERHMFLATSAKYPARKEGAATAGVPLEGGVVVARGTDGRTGSGVYSVDVNGESAGPKVEELLAGFRKEGLVEKVWEEVESQFVRITGKVSAA